MKKIKFIASKGLIEAGYIGSYTDERAKELVDRGFAQYVEDAPQVEEAQPVAVDEETSEATIRTGNKGAKK